MVRKHEYPFQMDEPEKRPNAKCREQKLKSKNKKKIERERERNEKKSRKKNKHTTKLVELLFCFPPNNFVTKSSVCNLFIIGKMCDMPFNVCVSVCACICVYAVYRKSVSVCVFKCTNMC